MNTHRQIPVQGRPGRIKARGSLGPVDLLPVKIAKIIIVCHLETQPHVQIAQLIQLVFLQLLNMNKLRLAQGFVLVSAECFQGKQGLVYRRIAEGMDVERRTGGIVFPYQGIE